MFSKPQAAQFFVVAWVKDWSLRLYLHTVSGGERIEWDDAHRYYPWLPDDRWPFAYGIRARKWAADAMRPINDRLWDAKDNTARLRVAEHVMLWDSAGAKMVSNRARRQMIRDNAKLKRLDAAAALSYGEMRRGSGHDWAVCK